MRCFCCSSYSLIVDRDVNGARNIAIKRLKELVLLPWSYTWVKGNLHVQICRLTNAAEALTDGSPMKENVGIGLKQQIYSDLKKMRLVCLVK